MPGDELAAELLSSFLEADPLAGSLYGFRGYDELLPDFSGHAESEHARRLASIAERAEQAADDGLGETELQTLDFVRCLARGMADAAAVPVVEFTVSDTFASPVGAVLTSLPKVQLDTEERKEGYLTRLGGLPGMLATVAHRHEEGARAGRTPVARLVEAAIAQLDLMIKDPTLGAMARTEPHGSFSTAVAVAIDEHARPALAVYRDVLRASVLPTARDDDHPGICYLPDGEAMYRALARQHTSMSISPDELHAMGHEIVGEVRRRSPRPDRASSARPTCARSSTVCPTTPHSATRAARRCSRTAGASSPPPRRRHPNGSPWSPTCPAPWRRSPRPKSSA